jgi:hypothetical protein
MCDFLFEHSLRRVGGEGFDKKKKACYVINREIQTAQIKKKKPRVLLGVEK